MSNWITGTVVENYHWNARLCSLRVKAELPDFMAGQFVRLGLSEGDSILARPYSFVNAPGEPLAEFYFNSVPDGPLSPRLHRLGAGDEVLIANRVAGFLTLAEIPDAKHLWMLSTGTAIGPFLSILKTAEPWRRFERIILVHGVRTAEELTYRELTTQLLQQYSTQFVRVNSVTREPITNAISSRIPSAIETGILEKMAGLDINDADTQLMICGNPGMVADCHNVLQARGLKKHRRRDPGQITAEIYK